MNWLTKYKTPRRSPSGHEWLIIKKLPLIFLMTILLPVIAGCVFYLFFNSAKLMPSMIIYMVVGVILILWSFLIVLAIGVVIVYIMKGPAYVADGYLLPEHLKPLPIDKDQFFEE